MRRGARASSGWRRLFDPAASFSIRRFAFVSFFHSVRLSGSSFPPPSSPAATGIRSSLGSSSTPLGVRSLLPPLGRHVRG